MDPGASSPAQSRIGPILLAPGYRPRHVVSIFFVTCVGVSMIEFANILTPLILGQQLHIAPTKQGIVAGTLGATQQIGTLLFVMVAGALADILGRRAMLLWTLIGLFLCLLAYPFVFSVTLLFVLRFLWGLAFAGYSSSSTVAMDIPDNRSRGKFNSLALLVPWLAASGFILVTSRWPGAFRGLGYSAHGALFWTCFLVALFPLSGAIVTAAFFNDPYKRTLSATSAGVADHSRAIFGKIRDVLAYARGNRNFGLILFIGSVARSDTLIIGSFLGLWIVNAGRVEGIDAFTAAKTAGLIAAIRFITKVTGAPLFGVITDKVNRMGLMLASLAMMTAAFGFFGLITNPFGFAMMVAAFLMGFAESAESIASQSLLAQEAPAHLRGSTVGVFSFLGTTTMAGINLLGGYLFDKVGFSSPMLMEGVFHLLVLIISIWILQRDRPRAKGNRD